MAELLPKVRHVLAPTVFSVSTEPVQSAPAKEVIVADITREAEARRAVETKTKLNCILARRIASKRLENKVRATLYERTKNTRPQKKA